MPAYNSTYKKLAVQWLNEALCFVSSFVVAGSFVLRNRQLLVAAKRQAVKKLIQKVKVFGYLLDKNFIQPNLRRLVLVYSHSAVMHNFKRHK